MPMRNKVALATNMAPGNGAAFVQPGGRYQFSAESSAWGGGSAKLQMKTENGTYVDVANASLAANGSLVVELPAGEVRVVVTTATAVYATLYPIRESS